MKIKRLFGWAALAASLNAGQGAEADSGPAAAHEVTICVDNAGALFNLQTRVLADRLLATAGVQAAWRLGKPGPTRTEELVIEVDFAAATTPESRSNGLAQTYPFQDGVRQIKVYGNRVRAIAAAATMSESRLAAHVLAHEIGHVLQRLSRHSDTGLMKARWSAADYEVMARKLLPFAAEDLALIRRGLEAAAE